MQHIKVHLLKDFLKEKALHILAMVDIIMEILFLVMRMVMVYMSILTDRFIKDSLLIHCLMAMGHLFMLIKD
jgi:hypothetical protein